MKTGDRVELTPMRSVKKGVVEDAGGCVCSFLKYDEQSECIFLKLQANELSDVSLDVIYKCTVSGETEVISCTGRISERYVGKCGKTLQLRIENGFYKININ